MKQKIKDLIIVLLAIIAFCTVLFKVEYCTPDNTKVIIKSDTIVEYTSDTIFPKDTLYVYLKSPKVIDSIFIPDTSGRYLCDYIREYKDTINDTNITIYTTDLIRGQLVTSGLSYKLKVPIKIIDSVKTTITNKIEPKYNLYAGVTLSKNNISPMLNVSKKDVYLQVGYNIIDKQPMLGIGYRFYSK